MTPQQTEALRKIMNGRDPADLPQHSSGRTTIEGQDYEIPARQGLPAPGLSLETYAALLGTGDDGPAIPRLPEAVVVEVESGTGWGAVEVVRTPVPERSTIVEDL